MTFADGRSLGSETRSAGRRDSRPCRTRPRGGTFAPTVGSLECIPSCTSRSKAPMRPMAWPRKRQRGTQPQRRRARPQASAACSCEDAKGSPFLRVGRKRKFSLYTRTRASRNAEAAAARNLTQPDRRSGRNDLHNIRGRQNECSARDELATGANTRPNISPSASRHGPEGDRLTS